jgi:hypothetical protein
MVKQTFTVVAWALFCVVLAPLWYLLLNTAINLLYVWQGLQALLH